MIDCKELKREEATVAFDEDGGMVMWMRENFRGGSLHLYESNHQNSGSVTHEVQACIVVGF